MRTAVVCGILLSTATIIGAQSSANAQNTTSDPSQRVCKQGKSGTSCQFSSMQQCRATLHQAGNCIMNPGFRAASTAAPARPNPIAGASPMPPVEPRVTSTSRAEAATKYSRRRVRAAVDTGYAATGYAGYGYADQAYTDPNEPGRRLVWNAFRQAFVPFESFAYGPGYAYDTGYAYAPGPGYAYAPGSWYGWRAGFPGYAYAPGPAYGAASDDDVVTTRY